MQLISAIPYSSHCCNLLHPRRTHPRRHNKRSSSYATKLIISAASRRDAYGHDRDYPGKWVDESMVVLRKRIHEMKITEANCETPDEWMEWEKRYYCERYTSDLCEAVGVLQSLLINSRPGFALGMAAIIALSIPLSAGGIIFRLVEATIWLAARIHL